MRVKILLRLSRKARLLQQRLQHLICNQWVINQKIMWLMRMHKIYGWSLGMKGRRVYATCAWKYITDIYPFPTIRVPRTMSKPIAIVPLATQSSCWDLGRCTWNLRTLSGRVTENGCFDAGVTFSRFFVRHILPITLAKPFTSSINVCMLYHHDCPIS